MGTSKEYHDYVLECLCRAGTVTTKRMMGEYLVYYCGKHIADICDNRLLFKQTKTSRQLLADCELEYPYQGSKNLLFVATDFENPELMQQLLKGMYCDLSDSK